MPLCEACGRAPAVSFSAFNDRDGKPWRWALTCYCTSTRESYYVKFPDFFREPQHWIEHLTPKFWFSAERFLEALGRALEARVPAGAREARDAE